MSNERMTQAQEFEAELDALFSAARDEVPGPVPRALQARLVADALAARPVVARGWLARLGALWADMGGVPGLAGVGAAGLAGVWIGFSGPGVTGDLVAQFWQGAANVSPTVSDWVDDGLLTQSSSTLLSLMSEEGE